MPPGPRAEMGMVWSSANSVNLGLKRAGGSVLNSVWLLVGSVVWES